MNKFLIITLLLAFSVGTPAAPKDKALSDFFRDKTKIDNPMDLRDPFKAPIAKKETEGSSKAKNYYVAEGRYSNIGDNDLTEILPQTMKVVGVLIGKERRAMVLPKEEAKQVVILKEGMKLGPDKAELKAILPGGIILVEKIVNVYGQEEYLETVIPISR